MLDIEVNQLSKSFQDKKVLNNISLQIERGEIFGLLGPSGAGKTTLIKIITGQLKASEGSVKLFEKDIYHLKQEIMREVGMVMDNSGLYERLTCLDNLQVFSRIFGLSEKRCEEVLELVGLREAKKVAVQKLSKGMRQRLLLARAILHTPKLLFLDEPTSGLDPSMAREIHTLLLKMKEEGTTCFLTTHNMEEASKLCDNIALLNEGKIVEYGVPDELCRKYNSENMISILLKNGTKIVLPNKKQSASYLHQYLEAETIEAIHSSEPNLEAVFMTLTGRGLME